MTVQEIEKVDHSKNATVDFDIQVYVYLSVDIQSNCKDLTVFCGKYSDIYSNK